MLNSEKYLLRHRFVLEEKISDDGVDILAGQLVQSEIEGTIKSDSFTTRDSKQGIIRKEITYFYCNRLLKSNSTITRMDETYKIIECLKKPDGHSVIYTYRVEKQWK